MKKPVLAFWVRKEDENSVGSWSLWQASDENIHIIVDPEYFGYKVIRVPQEPPKSLLGKHE